MRAVPERNIHGIPRSGLLQHVCECNTCARGWFQDKMGQTFCRDCPPNTTTPASLASTVRLNCTCKEGYWHARQNAGEPCQPCPPGAKCEGGVMAPYAKKSHWQVTQDVYFRCISGMYESPCVGKKVCLEGREGIACSHCKAGYHRFGRDCYVCKEGDNAALKFYWFLLLVVFYALRRIVNTPCDGLSTPSTKHFTFSFRICRSSDCKAHIDWLGHPPSSKSCATSRLQTCRST